MNDLKEFGGFKFVGWESRGPIQKFLRARGK